MRKRLDAGREKCCIIMKNRFPNHMKTTIYTPHILPDHVTCRSSCEFSEQWKLNGNHCRSVWINKGNHTVLWSALWCCLMVQGLYETELVQVCIQKMTECHKWREFATESKFEDHQIWFYSTKLITRNVHFCICLKFQISSHSNNKSTIKLAEIYYVCYYMHHINIIDLCEESSTFYHCIVER